MPKRPNYMIVMHKLLLSVFISLLIFTQCDQPKENLEIKFVEQSPPNGISIRGSSVVSDQVAWFSGAKGRFVKTTNAGKNWLWDSISNFTHLDFRDIHAFSDQEALVLSAGFPAKIFKHISMDVEKECKVFKNLLTLACFVL